MHMKCSKFCDAAADYKLITNYVIKKSELFKQGKKCESFRLNHG